MRLSRLFLKLLRQVRTSAVCDSLPGIFRTYELCRVMGQASCRASRRAGDAAGVRSPAIGGKDSMSGTFNDINVPPTLIAFAAGTVDARKVVSPEFKAAGNSVYIVRHTPESDLTPDTAQLMLNFEKCAQGNRERGYSRSPVCRFRRRCRGYRKDEFRQRNRGGCSCFRQGSVRFRSRFSDCGEQKRA